ncbi:hypothetical protein [Altererythrobacter sp. ZODW24]|uniref:hypothetical protein n=1 Tax=Altererythrobacter sp. ZODW24 TaxID=2185142 RepID=UPI0013B43147|nr:hypothetical protein [Altererythrobacter sp. ZODW24]
MRDVVSLGRTKEAALYFDRVLPDDILAFPAYRNDDDLLSSLVPFASDPELAAKVISNILPDGLDSVTQVIKNTALSAIFLSLCQLDKPGASADSRDWHEKHVDKLLDVADLPKDFVALTVEEQKILLKNTRIALFKALGFSNAPQWIDPKAIGGVDHEVASKNTGVICSIQNLRLVDANALSWEEICEFRADERSRSDLRRLRIFLTENFEGKEERYVQDKLEEVLDEYETVARRWGFKTALNSLSVAFSNDSALASSSTGALALLGGAPLGLAAAASTIFPLGKVSVEIAKNWIDDRHILNSSPIKYLSSLKRLSQQAQAKDE